MNIVAKQLFLALALLLSQTVEAMHGIDCLDEPHTESCQICAIHVDNSLHPSHALRIEPVSHQNYFQAVSKLPVRCYFSRLYLSRAPPIKY